MEGPSTATTPGREAPAVRPPAVFLLCIVSMLVLHWLLPLHAVVREPWSYLGLAPVALGGWLNLAAHERFRRRGTTADPFGQPEVLVIGGPFRYTRNPMYLGGVLILLGLGILFGSGTPFLVIPVFARLVTTRFIRPEEQSMSRRFGEDYQAYRARVRRWL